ncbi:MAG: flavodoxin family protein [Chitinispirillales bacterium]|jgi:multimeric flavodoxin WrbA|nr:flavodoxin family protein [Chitinispirillales bacterium]
MKILLINGSPRSSGCTFRALCEIERELKNESVSTEIFQIGANAISGCRGCGYCRENKKCVVDDSVNSFAQTAAKADGFIFGSPVHYAAASGGITAFMDRLFYSSSYALEYKPAAAIISCRRGGASAAFDQLNKYFTINNMPIVSSQYWNMVHGNTPEEVEKDLEGLQIMRTLGKNMAWLLKSIEAGAKAGIAYPKKEEKVKTNFIR